MADGENLALKRLVPWVEAPSGPLCTDTRDIGTPDIGTPGTGTLGTGTPRHILETRRSRDELTYRFIERIVRLLWLLPLIGALAGVAAATVWPPGRVFAWWGALMLATGATRALLLRLLPFYAENAREPSANLARFLWIVVAFQSSAMAFALLWTFPSGVGAADLTLLLAVACLIAMQPALGLPNTGLYWAAAAPPLALLAAAALRAQHYALLGPVLMLLGFAFVLYGLERGAVRHRIAQIAARNRLTEALEEAQASNRAKSRFIASMSHELRTPLNAILGFSEVIATQTLGPVGSVKYLEYARDIHFSGSHLLNLINDVLDLAKIEAGKTEIYQSALDPCDIVARASRIIMPRAQRRNVTIRTDVSIPAPRLFADERAATQILLNVLSNAVKYNRAGGTVNVLVKNSSTDGALFIVSDTGPGIPESEMERLFQPFEQGENVRQDVHGGTGLGLPIVRSLMKLHGGNVWMESTVGEGTTVFIHFPAGPRQERPPQSERQIAS